MSYGLSKPEKSLPYHIRGAFRGYETALARYVATKGIPLSHFYILRLEWNDQGHSQKHVADKSFMTESVASQVIKAMEEDGLLHRNPDPTDSRKKLVCLTSKGEELRKELSLDGLGISKTYTPNISKEDVKTAMRVLMQIRGAFENYNTEYKKENS